MAPLVELIVDQSYVYAPERKPHKPGPRTKLTPFTDNCRQEQLLNLKQSSRAAFRRLSTCHQNKEPQVGYLPYLYRNMASPCIRAPSRTHCASDMDGNYHIYLIIVCMAANSTYNMPSAAQREDKGGFPSIHSNEIQDTS